MNDTKEHILNVSFSLFLQKNFKEVTMQEIVEKTGMSKGAFYHYFESKEQLFLEVVDYFVSAFIMDYNKLSKESLYQFYHDYVKYHANMSFLQNRMDGDSGFNYYVLMFDAMKLFPSFRDKVTENLQAELRAWEEIVRSARDKGEINSSMTDEQIANLFIYTSDGVGMHNVMKGRIKEMPEALLTVWDGLYQEIKT
ncbi:TetR family transcriptional regulator [Hydrogenispora ethanolica]|uniref:TetR family transcriptional regulator n=1 Tax=Hydrogenispora ethanolica TaxID=1082276 RepID=A0A4R1R2V8_HYDET|nr:TetR/AcrR family transcriptional regulator [Hydrogenispora ethanolica]TCL59733.1 TetR family transcriptional regulator [Hydrogenispora ethanolica]